ncbi:MAG: nucleoside-diphosphate kinase [Phyllobacterium sp.]
MFRKTPCLLTTKDFNVLEVMLERSMNARNPLQHMLQQKLREASIVFRDDIPPQVVTLNSRVKFRIDDGPKETRIVVQNELNNSLVGMTMPITTLRGLALLGLMQGQSVSYELQDGAMETTHLDAVLFQPEAAQRRQSSTGFFKTEPEEERGQVLSFDLRRKAANQTSGMAFTDPDDDPGPGAA